MDVLKGEGLVRSEHGRGVFVRSRPTVRRLARNRFAKAWHESGGTGQGAYDVEMRQLGLKPGIELVELGPVTPPPEIAERLGLKAGEKALMPAPPDMRRRPADAARRLLCPVVLRRGHADGRADSGRGGIYKTRAEAARALRKVLSQLDDGSYVPPRPDTVGTYLRDWLEAQRPHVAPNTWVTCRNHIAYYLAPSEADCATYKARTGQDRPGLTSVRLQDLTPEVASRHLGLLLERGRRDGGGLRPWTVRGVRITLNAALAGAYVSGKLPRPVRVKRVAVPKRPPTVYSPEQTGSFLAVAAGDRLVALWCCWSQAACVPARSWACPGRLSTWRLAWSRSTRSSSRSKPGRARRRDQGWTIPAPPSPRSSSLPRSPAAVLRAWRTAQAEQRRLWPWRKEHNDLVFTKEDGSPLKPDWLNRRFKQLARQAGLPRWRQGLRPATWLGDGSVAGRCPSQAGARGHAAQQLLDHCRHLHPRDAQVTMDGRHRHALGGVGVALGVVEHLLVGPGSGPLHPGGQPVDHGRLAGGGHLGKALGQVGQVGYEGPVGLADPKLGDLPNSSAILSPTSVLEIPTIRPARRHDSPSSSTAPTASSRTSSVSGRVPPRPGGRGGSRWG
jgi:hypothetical protein